MFSKKFKIAVTAFFVCIIFSLSGCDDKDTQVVVPEDKLQISVDAGPMVIIPGPDFDFTVNILSAIPTKGVLIEVDVKGEVNGMNYFLSPGVLTSAKNTVIKLSYLPRQVICVCKVRVTSKGDVTNKAEASFKLAYK